MATAKILMPEGKRVARRLMPEGKRSSRILMPGDAGVVCADSYVPPDSRHDFDQQNNPASLWINHKTEEITVVQDSVLAPNGLMEGDHITLGDGSSSYLQIDLLGVTQNALMDVKIWMKPFLTSPNVRFWNPDGQGQGEWIIDMDGLNTAGGGDWVLVDKDSTFVTVNEAMRSESDNTRFSMRMYVNPYGSSAQFGAWCFYVADF